MQDAYVAVQEAVLIHLSPATLQQKQVQLCKPDPSRSAAPITCVNVTILKAIGAVERLARLEESVQFHHKSLVYILYFDRPSCKWTVKYIISCGKELHKFLYTYYQSCCCNHFQAHLLLKDVFIVHFVITCI